MSAGELGGVAVDKAEAGFGHVLDGGGHVLVGFGDELVVEDAGRGDEAGGDDVDADVVLVDFGGEAGGEAFEGGLAHAVDGAAAAGGLELRMEGGVRRDVEDPAGLLLLHLGEDELGEVERARTPALRT